MSTEDLLEKVGSLLRRCDNYDKRLEDLEIWVADYEEREAKKGPCH